MNLTRLFQQQVDVRPDAAAIVEWSQGKRCVTTFAQLEERSRRAAAALSKHGLKARDVVLVFLPMSAVLYEVVLGVLRSGMAAMFLDPSISAKDMDASCALRSAQAMIGRPKAHWLRLICASLRRIPLKLVVGGRLPGAFRWSCREMGQSGWCECDADTPALITFTSGSTGQPKAVVRTHGFLDDQHRVLERALDLEPGEIDLTTLPIFLLANLASGVTSVIPATNLRRPDKFNSKPLLEQIAREKINRSAASPAFFDRLLSEGCGTGLGGLRKIHVGGGPVFPRLLKGLSEAAPDAKIEAIYGSTEAEPIAHLSACALSKEDHRAMREGRGLLAGRPVEDIELRILEDRWGQPTPQLSEAEFSSRECVTGEAGEIVVTGSHVLAGYLNGCGDTETKIHVGERVWHRTGDAGYLDQAGRLWLLGRCSGRVQDDRGTLWPLAVEGAAMEHPRVARAALWARRGERWLAVELMRGADANVLGELRKVLDWAKLDQCRVVRKIPVDRRHNAKLDYRALKKLLDG